MMSQAEIWKMEDYCKNRNSERGKSNTYSIWNIMFLLAGLVMFTLSACLIVYVFRVGIDMTGIFFVVAGAVGILLGSAIMMLSRMKL